MPPLPWLAIILGSFSYVHGFHCIPSKSFETHRWVSNAQRRSSLKAVEPDDEIVEVFFIDPSEADALKAEGLTLSNDDDGDDDEEALAELVREWERKNQEGTNEKDAKGESAEHAAEAELDALAAALFANEEVEGDEGGASATTFGAPLQQDSPPPSTDEKRAVDEKEETLVSSSGSGTGEVVADHMQGCSVGIDLGTTNSAVAAMVGGKAEILVHAQGPHGAARTIPSVVAFGPNGQVLVGKQASLKLDTGGEGGEDEEEEDDQGVGALPPQSSVQPWAVFSSVKRVIGRTVAEAASAGEDLAVLGVATTTGGAKQGDDPVALELALELEGGDSSSTTSLPSLGVGRRSPECVSAEVLKSLLATASAALGSARLLEKKKGAGGGGAAAAVQITRAVVTVPAYFNPKQCAATLRACELAGLAKVKLLKEPEAAALAYGLGSSKRDELVLVFDLGGGTLDVSVLEVGGGVIEVIATSGDNHLGGDDFDAALADFLGQKLLAFQAASQAASQATPSTSRRASPESERMGRRRPQPPSASTASAPAAAASAATAYDLQKALSPTARRRLRQVAEGCKRKLGQAKSVDVSLDLGDFGLELASPPSSPPRGGRERDGGGGGSGGGGVCVVPVSRALFGALCEPLLRRVMTPVREVALAADVLLPGDVGFAADAVLVQKAMDSEREEKKEREATVGKQQRQQLKKDARRERGEGAGVVARNAAAAGEILPTTAAAADEDDGVSVDGGAPPSPMSALKKTQQRGRADAKQRQQQSRRERAEVKAAATRATAAAASGLKKGRGGGTASARGAAGGVLMSGAGGGGGGSPTPWGGGKSSAQQQRLRLFPMGKRVVDTVILVGGATRMPLVRSLLAVSFGVEPRRTVDPDEAVALGAAVQAGMMDGDASVANLDVLNPFQASILRYLQRKGAAEAEGSPEEGQRRRRRGIPKPAEDKSS